MKPGPLTELSDSNGNPLWYGTLKGFFKDNNFDAEERRCCYRLIEEANEEGRRTIEIGGGAMPMVFLTVVPRKMAHRLGG